MQFIPSLRFLLCITWISLSLMWISCGKVDSKAGDMHIFRMNLDSGLPSLDPAMAEERGQLWMTAQLFNGLISLDSTLRPLPDLARSWEISEDGRTYTFYLRTDVWYHAHPAFGADSSRKMVAEDFVYAFTRVCDPAIAAKGAWVFDGKIKGLEAFKEGEASGVEGLKALNDSIFQIELIEPFPPFLGLLSMPFCYVVPKEVVETVGQDAFGRNPVGTGPFSFYYWEPDQRLVLHRNPDYFEFEGENRLPYLDAISVYFIPSRLTAFVAFKQDRLDFIGDLDASYRDEVLNRDGTIKPAYEREYQFLLAPQLNTEFLAFMMDSSFSRIPALRDVRVRKALNYALDREKLVAYLLNGMGYAANSGFVPRGLPNHDPVAVPGYPYDPLKARQLLREAGYPDGKGFPDLTLHSTDKYAAISEFIQKSLENIGIRVRIENLESGTLRSESKTGQLDFWRASWIADYPDGENYLALFTQDKIAPGGPNRTRYYSAAYETLFAEAMRTPQDSLRWGLYQQLDSMIIADAPIIPLYYDRSFRMLNRKFKGLGTNPRNALVLKSVQVVK